MVAPEQGLMPDLSEKNASIMLAFLFLRLA
jgi:hypothetical protein